LCVPLRKVRAAGAAYAVINDAWHPAPDISHLVTSVCSSRHGISADGLVRIRHQGRAHFDLETFSASGSPMRAPVSALACCAVAIRDEYGYQCAQLREGGVTCAVEVNGDQVELLLIVRDQPSRPCRLGPWRAFQVDVGAAHTVLVRVKQSDGPELACPSGMLGSLRTRDLAATVITAASGRRIRLGDLEPAARPGQVSTAVAVVAAAAVGRALGFGGDSGLFVEGDGTTQLLRSSPTGLGMAFRMTNHAWLVAKGDFAMPLRAAAVTSVQSPTVHVRAWTGGDQWLPISRAC
jgi:hypothetical protein